MKRRMATRASFSDRRSSLWTREELARRVALAREPVEAPASRPPLWRFAAEAQALGEVVRRRRRQIIVRKAENPRTVMVLPGFMTHPYRMRYMAQHLEKAGHTAKRWGLGWNLGPTEENLEQLEARLLELHERSGEKVVLLGWSLGGIFGRELAKRQPQAVAKVITMGSPFSGDPRANNVWRIYQFVTGHSVDNPPVETDVAEKPPVETIALWSPRDGMIDVRAACGKPGERDRAVSLRCTHIGFTYATDAIETVLEELESV